jgi:hypothetical protein
MTLSKKVIAATAVIVIIVVIMIIFVISKGSDSAPTTPLTPTQPAVPMQPEYIGCYNDKQEPNRALPTTPEPGNRTTFAKCLEYAKAAGSPLFGFQYGSPTDATASCWIGDSTTTLESATRYGPSTRCAPITNQFVTVPGANVGLDWTFGLYKTN